MVRRSVWMLVSFALLAALMAAPPSGAVVAEGPFLIVTRAGGRIPAMGPPKIKGEVAYFRSVKGTPLALHLRNVDVAETERINGVDLPVKVEDLRSAPANEAAPVRPGRAEGPDQASDRAVAGYTITNADLKRLRAGRLFLEGGEVATDFTAQQQAVETGKLSPEQLQEDMRSQWQARAKANQARMAELERQQRTLLARKAELEQNITTLGAGSAQKYGKELDGVKSQLASVARELELVNKGWQTLKEEAKHAGIPDEWLR